MNQKIESQRTARSLQASSWHLLADHCSANSGDLTQGG